MFTLLREMERHIVDNTSETPGNIISRRGSFNRVNKPKHAEFSPENVEGVSIFPTSLI